MWGGSTPLDERFVMWNIIGWAVALTLDVEVGIAAMCSRVGCAGPGVRWLCVCACVCASYAIPSQSTEVVSPSCGTRLNSKLRHGEGTPWGPFRLGMRTEERIVTKQFREALRTLGPLARPAAADAGYQRLASFLLRQCAKCPLCSIGIDRTVSFVTVFQFYTSRLVQAQ